MSKCFYLMKSMEQNDDDDLFKLKYIHLITNKSIEIRNQIIDSFDLILKNSENDFFNIIYENITKLIKLNNQNADNENEDENQNNCVYKTIKKNYSNNLKSNDNLLNLRITVFNCFFNLIKFPPYEFKTQFALIQVCKIIKNNDLLSVLQLRYFIKIARNYFNIDSEKYLNYSYLIINWLNLDYGLKTFPFLIEYDTSNEFFENNFDNIFLYYFAVKQNKQKLLQVYNILKDNDEADENEIIKKFCESNLKKVLTYFFNYYLISKKKSLKFCEDKIDVFMKDLNLNLKEIVKSNFSVLILDVLLNFNQINFNVNDFKNFETNILGIISYFIRKLNEKEQSELVETNIISSETSIKLFSN